MKQLLKRYRNLIIFWHDLVLAGLSFPLALYLRVTNDFMVVGKDYWIGAMVLTGCIYGMYAIWKRSYRRVWRYISAKDIYALAKSVAVVLLVSYSVLFLTMSLEMIPRSLPLIQAMVMLAMLTGPRLLLRLLNDRDRKMKQGESVRRRIPVLLVCAGNEAELFVREAKRNPEFPYHVIAIVDDRPDLIGRDMHGVRIYGTYAKLAEIIKKCERKGERPQRIILTDPHMQGDDVRTILSVSEAENVPLARMPRLTDFTRGGSAKLNVRPIDVEDILGRPQSNLDRDAMRALVRDKRVLVTGAGGSIGSELVRQVSAFDPSAITLVDNNEFALYKMDRELHNAATTHPYDIVLEDIRDAEALDRVFTDAQPEIVFHAAALKHVPMMEDQPHQAVLTNVMGSRHVADACAKHDVSLMVQVSTDKAVNPTNVMGATKRVAETYAQTLGQTQQNTRFVTVRFGNVLGSNGSVVPLFQRQLEAGGPITITHPDMTRYFMTIKEAVQLILQAAALPSEEPVIYVLDMGEPVRIRDLAEQMIRLAGLEPHEDIQLEYIGLRPGEKLYEELFHDAEALQETAHPSIRRARARKLDLAELITQIETLIGSARQVDMPAVRAHIQTIVPEYSYGNEEETKETA